MLRPSLWEGQVLGQSAQGTGVDFAHFATVPGMKKWRGLASKIVVYYGLTMKNDGLLWCNNHLYEY